MTNPSDTLPAEAVAGIISHMNDDHADAMLLYCTVLAGVNDATAATMTAVDRLGFEMAAETPRGVQAVRLAFPAPVENSGGVRKALVAMVREARARG